MIPLVQSGFAPVQSVEFGDHLLNAKMGSIVKQMPVQTLGVGPFPALSELVAHEEQLFARV